MLAFRSRVPAFKHCNIVDTKYLLVGDCTLGQHRAQWCGLGDGLILIAMIDEDGDVLFRVRESGAWTSHDRRSARCAVQPVAHEPALPVEVQRQRAEVNEVPWKRSSPT